jgi:hypothetical protein
MSNDYFKAQGWFKNYARNSQDSRGVFQQLVKEDEEVFKLASAETDKIKAMINKKYGPGSMKYGSEISQPATRPDVIEIDAINSFVRRNPAAEGGRMEFDDGSQFVKPSIDGSRPGYAYDTSMFKLKDIKKYRAEGKTAKEIADIYNVGLSKYEAFIKDNKNKLPMTKGKKINLTEDMTQRIKNYDKWAKKNDKPLYKDLGTDSIGSDTRKRIRDNPNAIWNLKPGKDFVKFPLKNISEEMLDLPVRLESKFYPAGNIGTNQYGEQTTLRNIFEVSNRTDSGAALVDEFYENPTEELFKKLKQKRKDNLASERIKNLPPKERKRIRERNLISERKWRNSEKGQAYYKKLMAEKGIFSAVTPEEKIWRNIYRAARQTRNETPRFKIQYPKNVKINSTTGLPEPVLSKKGNKYVPWHQIYKDISFLDKETGQIIKFDGVKDWMKNNVKDGVKKYNKAIENYKLQTNISNIDVDGQSLGDIYKQDKIKKGATATEVRLASPATVNHKSGLNNFWDLEVTTSTANQELNNKIQSKITAYKNATNDVEKNKIFKQMQKDASNIVGGGTLEIDGQIIGKDPTSKTIATALEKELNLKPKQLVDYIDGKKDFVGFSSGFNTDLLMKDPAIQKILNSKAGQAVKNAARGTAGTVGKVFGVADIVLGALDYENNISKGQKEGEALRNAVQAMSFNLYKTGDRARIEDVKERFVAKGGDGEIFDQATALNAKDQEINDLIFDSKKTADTFVQYAKEGRGTLTPDLEKSKADYKVLKDNLNKKIAEKIAERDSMIKSYKTNLQVSEAGGPIQIGGNEFFSQPFKDIKQSTMDKIAEENRKAYDMQKRQVNYTSGNIGNFLQNNIFTMNPQEKAELQRQINNMDERELYKFNLSRGMDPDNLIRFEDILRYKTNDPSLMGVNTTKYVNYDDRKAEGGIIGLKSKYEYKK